MNGLVSILQLAFVNQQAICIDPVMTKNSEMTLEIMLFDKKQGALSHKV